MPMRRYVMCRTLGAALLLLVAGIAPEVRAQACPATCAAFAAPAPGAFARAMPLTAALYVDDASLPENRRDDPGGKLAACIGGTLRGVASASLLGGRAVYFLDIGGDVADIGQPIALRYCSAQDGDLVADVVPSFNADDTPAFDPAASLGSPSAPYRVQAEAATLPVELTRFEAVVSGDAVQLAWETASETNNAGFYVEQRGSGAADWRSVGFVAGAGTTSQPQRYRLIASALPAGRHRFRLRQVNYDGAASYSAEVEVRVALPEAAAFELRPSGRHPARHAAAFVLTLAATQPVEVDVFDLLGRPVARLHQGEVEAGVPLALRWTVAGASSGVYVLRARGAHFAAARTFVVE